jgi:hypothetical protein
VTEHSQNGWSASASLPLRPLVVNGVAFAPGIRDDDDVETVLRYVVEQYAKRVEPLRSPGCWGWSYRANRNDPNSLSNHASGTAVDINAPAHPNGVATFRTFTAAQQAECHAILTEVDGAIRWGGDYTRTVDAMHWEVVCGPETLHAVAEKIRAKEDPVTPDDIKAIAEYILDTETVELRKDDGTSKAISVRNALTRILNPDES